MFFLQSIIALLLILVLDLVWFTLNGKIYNKTINDIQGSPIKLNLYGAVFAYIFIFLALLFIIFPSISQDETTQNKFILALKHGAMFGLIAYGIYNATNLATLKSYTVSLAITDTLWGTLVFFSAVAIAQFIRPIK